MSKKYKNVQSYIFVNIMSVLSTYFKYKNPNTSLPSNTTGINVALTWDTKIRNKKLEFHFNVS